MRPRRSQHWMCGECRSAHATRANAAECCTCIECGDAPARTTGTPPADVGRTGARYGALCDACAHQARVLFAQAELRNAAMAYAAALRGGSE